MATEALQREYLDRVRQLYDASTPEFQEVVALTWKNIQEWPDEDARPYAEMFFANPKSPFKTDVFDEAHNAVLKEYEPKFIKIGLDGYYPLAKTNWTRVLNAATPEEARAIAEQFIDAPKVDMGIFGQLTVR